MNRQIGFSLVELLVSLLLASIITTCLIQTYLAHQSHYLKLQKHVETDLDLHRIKELISNSVRHAGATPCVGIEHLVVIDSRDRSHQVKGVTFTNKPVESLEINRMGEVFTNRVDIKSPTQIFIATPLFSERDPLLIADCYHAEIHQIQQINNTYQGQFITLTKPITFHFEKAYVGEWIEEKWFIKFNKSQILSLFYHQANTEELSPLIHSINTKILRTQPKKIFEINLGVDADTSEKIIVAARNL